MTSSLTFHTRANFSKITKRVNPRIVPIAPINPDAVTAYALNLNRMDVPGDLIWIKSFFA